MRPHAALPRLLAAALLLAAGAGCASGGPPAAGAYVTGRCPVPLEVRGYPIVVTAEDAEIDPAWLQRFARGIANRWQVPSRRRGQFTGYRSVQSRVIPEVPRWSDDWTPTARHKAELLVSVGPKGVLDDPEVKAASGDGMFDATLHTWVGDPLPAAPQLPALPPGLADSVHLRVRFGIEPEPGVVAGVVRYARQQRPVRVIPGSLAIHGRAGEYAFVKYDVDALGQMVPGSFQTLDASSGDVVRSVEEGLRNARFSAAQSDCRAVPLTVVQRFGS